MHDVDQDVGNGIVIGGLALRTVLARQAEKIRRQGGKDGY